MPSSYQEINSLITQLGFTLINYKEHFVNSDNLDLYCSKHNYHFTNQLGNIRNGSGCRQCSKRNSKLEKEKEIKAFINSLSFNYGFQENFYQGSGKPLKLICLKHKKFTIHLDSLKRGSQCKKCSSEAIGRSLQFSTEFVKQTIIDMGLIPNFDEYLNSHQKLKVLCPKHGEISKNFDCIRRGHGCKKCGDESSSEKQRTPFNIVVEFIKNLDPDLIVPLSLI